MISVGTSHDDDAMSTTASEKDDWCCGSLQEEDASRSKVSIPASQPADAELLRILTKVVEELEWTGQILRSNQGTA